ncbi:oxidoreductase [Stipitochalara longipes BDJ]|nr:oxidoreductase [Stipitochalara longipes BDJ]
MPLKSVLITGCSEGGIGSSLAQSFQKHNHHVFATARTLSKLSHLADLPNVTLLTLDVTSSSSIAEAVQVVHAQTNGTLDILVNNAGVNYISPTLDLSIAKARQLFDVNFWGTVECVQAFAPLLINAKGGGLIVNNSSIVGVLNTPFQSIYDASKAAVTMFGEVLRLEMEPLGVKVLTVITGSVKTNINVTGSGFEKSEGSRYHAIEGNIENIAYGKGVPNQMTADEYAERVVGDILGGASGKIWRGGNATLVRCLGALPQAAMDKVVLRGSGLDALEKKNKKM